ncbi:DUF7405 family protein [Streptomyces sp. NBC_00503]|uniref:DUF7405 family protein n=1 Tax=Streptomyces sp. NBC_00503 TaxID=2903659 RepID=UPI002E7FDF65|nr:hypothetical protein [Streptomyces sp. NBC_00503]WUD86518.1 hypothetical protein OG490_38600 [Streptomyces sp. NBC_00503]
MSVRPAAQHAWEDTFRSDEAGRSLPPRHHRLLMLEVAAAPTAEDARELEAALAALEAAYGHGGEGLLMCLGWGPGWFSRYTAMRSPVAGPVPMARWENPVLEDYDACLHLASDREETVEEALRLLFGPGPLDQRGRLHLAEVRTGFVGEGLPAERRPKAAIPGDAPLLMGFHSGLKKNQATEEEVSVLDGPFAGGTTMHVSYIVLDTDSWYERGEDERAALMYSPRVTAKEAHALVEDAESDRTELPAVAVGHGRVGHAQATGRARLAGRPRINRRDFATLDHGVPGTHFVSLQRTMEDFQATRAMMNAADAPAHHGEIGVRRNNGINAFMDVRSRATFAVPPRAARAYPGLDAPRSA